jgi:NAD(P)-dependent dehydrogenase (short-subunit alcohol dehydrogenase family)
MSSFRARPIESTGSSPISELGPAGRLKDKVAIVSGGARGVGRAVARAFAREGATVVIADYGVELDGTRPASEPLERTVAEIVASGGHAHASFTDVAAEDQVDTLISGTIDRFGRLDVLVNAAAVMRHGAISETSRADWNMQMRVNVGGTFNTTRLAAVHWMRAGTGGRLLNFGSDAGLYGVGAELAYSASNAAVISLTLSCAQTLNAFGVTCNVIHPQAATRLTADIPRDQLPDSDRWAGDEFDPDHVPPALVYLASDAGGWINGCIVAAFGYEVHLYRLAGRAASIYSEGPWDQQVLARRIREEFGPILAK